MAGRQTSGGFQDGRRYHELAADYPLSRGGRVLSTGRIRAGTQVRLNRIMYGHETIEELEVETFEWPRRHKLQLLVQDVKLDCRVASKHQPNLASRN
jgi:hypothetical protein